MEGKLSSTGNSRDASYLEVVSIARISFVSLLQTATKSIWQTAIYRRSQ
jgi:hypothetical protein